MSINNLLKERINNFSLSIKTEIYKRLISSLSEEDKNKEITIIRCVDDI